MTCPSFTRLATLAVTTCLACTSAIAQISTGTGFFVGRDGYVVTSHHVIEGASGIAIRTVRGDTHPAEVVASDSANDLVVLKANVRAPALLVRESTTLRRGTEVLTVGFPQIGIQGAEPKVTRGLVSALSGIGGDPRMLQIQVPVQPGNSGGPLVTLDGAVVGVVAGKLDPTATLRRTGSLPESVNYAVKSNYLLELLRSIQQIQRLALESPSPSHRSLDAVALTAAIEESLVLVVADRGAAETLRRMDAAKGAIVETRPEAGTASSSTPHFNVRAGTSARCEQRVRVAVTECKRGGACQDAYMDLTGWCRATTREECRANLSSLQAACQGSGTDCASVEQAVGSTCTP